MIAANSLAQSHPHIKGKYVFIDLETTGLRPNVDSIIEIGLYYIVDGHLQFKWNRLLNPGIPISSHIQKITGITNAAVKNAPCFADIAAELYEILLNKVFVAHNARFDYAFLKNAFQNCNLQLDEKLLCTVRLSRIFYPEQKDHSLQAIQQRLELHHIKRHRALADVEIMVAFFQNLQSVATQSDVEKAIALSIKSQPITSSLAAHHTKNIPHAAGVYRLFSKEGVLLYVGHSISLREKIMAHFKMDYNQFSAIQLAQQVKNIDWVKTVGELGAMLKAATLIKKDLPIFNRILQKNPAFFTIQSIIQNDFLCLRVVNLANLPVKDLENSYGIFKTKTIADTILKNYIRDNDLCFEINTAGKVNRACFRMKIHKCKGACGKLEDVNDYNKRASLFLKSLGESPWPYQHKIAIKEMDLQNPASFEFHIIDKWHYLGSVKALTQANLDVFESALVDVDIYNILKKVISQNKLEIIHLDQILIAAI